MIKISIINGPNLNLLGSREPSIYGDTNFDSYTKKLKENYPEITFDFFQSNVEGELINQLHKVGFSYNLIILNAGAYTHTSIALADAIKAINSPVIEVHISNTYSREPFRHQSFISANAKGIIVGFGLNSYELAINSYLIENKHLFKP